MNYGKHTCFNPWAGPAHFGIPPEWSGPPSCEDTFAVYSSITATIAGVDQPLSSLIVIDRSSDFVCRGIGMRPGNGLLFQFQDEMGNNVVLGGSSNVMSDAITGKFCWPFPIFPELVYPAGSQIRYIVQSQSGAAITDFQVHFMGVRRFPRRFGQ